MEQNLALSIVHGFLNPLTVQQANQSANEAIQKDGFAFFFNFLNSISGITVENFHYKSHAYIIGYSILKKCLNLCPPEKLTEILIPLFDSCIQVFQREVQHQLTLKIGDYIFVISKFLDSKQFKILIKKTFEIENMYILLFVLSSIPYRDLIQLFSEEDFGAYFACYQRIFQWIPTLPSTDDLYYDIINACIQIYPYYLFYFRNSPNYVDASPIMISLIHLLDPQNLQIPEKYKISIWHTISKHCELFFITFQDLLVYCACYHNYHFIEYPQLSYEPFYIALKFLEKTKIPISIQIAKSFLHAALSVLKLQMGEITYSTDPSSIFNGIQAFSFFANCKEQIIEIVRPMFTNPFVQSNNNLGKIIRMFFFEIGLMINFPAFTHSESCSELLNIYFKAVVEPSFPFQIRFPLAVCLSELVDSQPDLAKYVQQYFPLYLQNLKWAHSDEGFQITYKALLEKNPDINPTSIVDHEANNISYHSLMNILIRYSQITPLNNAVCKYIIDTASTTTSTQDLQNFSLIVQIFCSSSPNYSELMDYVINLFLTLFKSGDNLSVGAKFNFLTPIINIMQNEPDYYPPTADAILQFCDYINQQMQQDPVTCKSIIEKFSHHLYHIKNIMSPEFYMDPRFMRFLQIFYQYLLEDRTPENLVAFITSLHSHLQTPIREASNHNFTYEEIIAQTHENPLEGHESEPPEIIEKRKKLYVSRYTYRKYVTLTNDSIKALPGLLPYNISALFQQIYERYLNEPNQFVSEVNMEFAEAFAKSLTPEMVLPILIQYTQYKDNIDTVYLIVLAIFKYWGNFFYHESIETFSHIFECVNSFYSIAFSQNLPSEPEALLTSQLYLLNPSRSINIFTNFLEKCVTYKKYLFGYMALNEIYKSYSYQVSQGDIQIMINYLKKTTDYVYSVFPHEASAVYSIISTHLEIPLVSQPDFFSFSKNYSEICQQIVETYTSFFITMKVQHPNIYSDLNYDGAICIVFLACLVPQSISDEMLKDVLETIDLVISSSSFSVKCLLKIIDARPQLARNVYSSLMYTIGSAAIKSYDDLDAENQQLLKYTLVSLPNEIFYELLNHYKEIPHFYKRILTYTGRPPPETLAAQ